MGLNPLMNKRGMPNGDSQPDTARGRASPNGAVSKPSALFDMDDGSPQLSTDSMHNLRVQSRVGERNEIKSRHDSPRYDSPRHDSPRHDSPWRDSPRRGPPREGEAFSNGGGGNGSGGNNGGGGGGGGEGMMWMSPNNALRNEGVGAKGSFSMKGGMALDGSLSRQNSGGRHRRQNSAGGGGGMQSAFSGEAADAHNRATNPSSGDINAHDVSPNRGTPERRKNGNGNGNHISLAASAPSEASPSNNAGGPTRGSGSGNGNSAKKGDGYMKGLFNRSKGKVACVPPPSGSSCIPLSALNSSQGGTTADATHPRSRLGSGAMPITAASNSSSMWVVEIGRLLSVGDAGSVQKALSMPGPHHGLAQCCVRRVKPMWGDMTYQLLFDDGEGASNSMSPLLFARMRKKTKSSSFVICTDETDLKRESPSCVAKLKSNYFGTEYVLWGRGGDAGGQKKGFEVESLCVGFKHRKLHGKKLTNPGPRALQVVVPAPDARVPGPRNSRAGHSASGDGGGGSDDGDDAVEGNLSHTLGLARSHPRPEGDESVALLHSVTLLQSVTPMHDSKTDAYTLDFGGRVKEYSVKNFQLGDWDDTDGSIGSDVLLLQLGDWDDADGSIWSDVRLQFGKMLKASRALVPKP
ncbi:hypothetical protein FOA52_015390 [Chlamydomonas sp. UWO 241]|nr:hypothetical protein FOA52_015390 [Chlamydomonas sp. UWO 241]